MRYFIISDTHFLHDNIVKYCDRPQNHNQLMIKNWRSVISDEDIVFHLGDLACGFTGREDKLKQIIDLLPGKKYLIRGNHDTRDKEFYLDLGFLDVRDYLIIETPLGKTMLCHYPLEVTLYNNKTYIKDILELMSIFKSEKCNFLIHGHTHNKAPQYEFSFNVSVERIDYTPIELETCLNGLKTYNTSFE